MKFGIRECVDVVLRARGKQTIGNKVFYKNEPVIYFDSVKTSTLEGAGTTVYAQGGRGNTRLLSWDGERTITFTMEDALISPIGLSILTGAGLIEAGSGKPIYVHKTLQMKLPDSFAQGDEFELKGDDKSHTPYFGSTKEDWVYVMKIDDNGEVIGEPYIASKGTTGTKIKIDDIEAIRGSKADTGYEPTDIAATGDKAGRALNGGDTILIDFYEEHTENVMEIDISADSFSGSFYLEGSTLFRDAGSGKDMPAEIIIPNCRVQSNFSFTLSGSGDPSTFTFTMDAFPGYTRFNPNKKVLCAIQVVTEGTGDATDAIRENTWHQ